MLCDVDDTLTWRGRLVPDAFVGLHRLREAGLKVIPVTGRPGGWVDQMARQWPVDGVIGENGGLWFYRDGDRMVRRFVQSAEVRAANRARLDTLATTILTAVPGAALASDQTYRELDLAIDFCEDVPRLSDGQIDTIVALFEDAGAQAKVSSIHVNGWFGDFDKLAGCRQMVADRWDEDLDRQRDLWLYVGDSPNDEPMFGFFPVSVGVANVADQLGRMSLHPKYVTSRNGGHGFAEVVNHVLRHRAV